MIMIMTIILRLIVSSIKRLVKTIKVSSLCINHNLNPHLINSSNNKPQNLAKSTIININQAANLLLIILNIRIGKTIRYININNFNNNNRSKDNRSKNNHISS